MRVLALPLSTFLLPDDSSEAQNLNRAAKGLNRKRKKPNSEEKEYEQKYAVDHLDAYQTANQVWPPEFPTEFQEKTAHLCRRSQEIIYLNVLTDGETKSLETWHAQDVQMTVGWARPRKDGVPCIGSSSKIWIRGPVDRNRGRFIDRLLTGSELLALQGVPFVWRDLEDGVFSNDQLVDLAGNAFSSCVLPPIFVALLIHAPIAQAFAFMKSVMPPTMPASFGAASSEDESQEESEQATDADVMTTMLRRGDLDDAMGDLDMEDLDGMIVMGT